MPPGRARGGFWGGIWGSLWLLVEATPSQLCETEEVHKPSPAMVQSSQVLCILLPGTSALCWIQPSIFTLLLQKPSVYILNGLVLFISASTHSYSLSWVKDSSPQTNNKTATCVLNFSLDGTVSRSYRIYYTFFNKEHFNFQYFCMLEIAKYFMSCLGATVAMQSFF